MLRTRKSNARAGRGGLGDAVGGRGESALLMKLCESAVQAESARIESIYIDGQGWF